MHVHQCHGLISGSPAARWRTVCPLSLDRLEGGSGNNSASRRSPYWPGQPPQLPQANRPALGSWASSVWGWACM